MNRRRSRYATSQRRDTHRKEERDLLLKKRRERLENVVERLKSEDGRRRLDADNLSCGEDGVESVGDCFSEVFDAPVDDVEELIDVSMNSTLDDCRRPERYIATSVLGLREKNGSHAPCSEEKY